MSTGWGRRMHRVFGLLQSGRLADPAHDGFTAMRDLMEADTESQRVATGQALRLLEREGRVELALIDGKRYARALPPSQWKWRGPGAGRTVQLYGASTVA